ncbi:RyR domain-containing protein [Nonomuraea sp. NPDC000554]|uniref:RyR domain-containing protein n=1 Tax=Nonomuraea sp. NPDC000554 TaxID=3154259 RepID=UPI00332B9949
MEDLAGTLRVFAVTEEAGEPGLIDEDLIERLAQAIHERYLVDGVRRGDTPALNESMIPWAALTEAKKAQNRGQAADIGRKLRAAGCVLAPSVEAPGAFPFTDAEVGQLAKMEHARWMKQHVGEGWVYGAERNDALKQHPDIVDWNALPEESREKDRAAVRSLPGILADAGFRIVRVTANRRLPAVDPDVP